MSENARLETFCDGVFAIALTLLIIDVKLPASAHVATSADLWRELMHLLPRVFAFVLSFGIILITWVNHHQLMKLVAKSSPPFMYANGLLLLAIVIVPFPTSLLGENVLTDHAAPAVVLYSATDALLALGWWALGRTALGPRRLTRDEHGTAQVRRGRRDAQIAFVFYSACAVVAVWLPLAMAALITVVWIVWFVYSFRVREAR